MNIKKELENLEKKYQEIQKLNLESEKIILGVKNDKNINRESELLKEKEEFKKLIEEKTEKLEKKIKESEELKNLNSILLEELKEAKRTRREGEINKFELLIAEKVKVNLESKMIKRCDLFKDYIVKKIEFYNTKLSKELIESEKAVELKNELKVLLKKVDIYIEEIEKKYMEEKIFLNNKSSSFHTNLKKEYDLEEDEYLFEKEKKNFILEKFIGLKAFNFLGIILIFFGLAMGFKTQLSNWIATDYMKSIFSYLLGVIFLLVGEKLYQKNKKSFARGMIGGGIGILYLSTLFSTIYLSLFSTIIGTLILVLLTFLAIILSLKYNSQIIASLSLIGGHLPYWYGIYVSRESNLYSLVIYSLILQGIILGLAWKKDWLHTKILGFILGSINMILMVTLLSEKVLSFSYIMIFTTSYTCIFINSYKKEKRSLNKLDYILLTINLILKFSLIYLSLGNDTPNWQKSTLMIVGGLIYLLVGDRLKENKIIRIFYVVSLGFFILVIPMIVSEKYIVFIWALEATILYIISRKYRNVGIEYGVMTMYLIVFIANFMVKGNEDYLKQIQNIFIVFLSFALYFTLKEKDYSPKIKKIILIFKYFIFTYTIFVVSSLIDDIVRSMLKDNGYDREIMLFVGSVTVIVINTLLRFGTYNVEKLQDKFSVKYLTVIQISYLFLINHLILNIKSPLLISNKIVSVLMILLILIINVYIFIIGRQDIHYGIFETNEKNSFWIIGESVYIILVSYLMMETVMNLRGSNFLINIVGLIICIVLVWKGFKSPSREIRRIGLGIGIIFILKNIIIDIRTVSNIQKIFGYFLMGAILIGTSYMYQLALKKMEKEKRNV